MSHVERGWGESKYSVEYQVIYVKLTRLWFWKLEFFNVRRLGNIDILWGPVFIFIISVSQYFNKDSRKLSVTKLTWHFWLNIFLTKFICACSCVVCILGIVRINAYICVWLSVFVCHTHLLTHAYLFVNLYNLRNIMIFCHTCMFWELSIKMSIITHFCCVSKVNLSRNQILTIYSH